MPFARQILFACLVILCPLYARAGGETGDQSGSVAINTAPGRLSWHHLMAWLEQIPEDQRGSQILNLFHESHQKWTQAQKENLLKNFLKNGDGHYSGALWASASKGDKPGEPNYQFHWVRDSAIAVEAVTDLYLWPDTTPQEREAYLDVMRGFVGFTRQIQELPIANEWILFDGPNSPGRFVAAGTPGAIPARYGEPKYRVEEVTDAHGHKVWVPKPFNDGWGRPQNDGPALRAIALTKIVRILQEEKKKKELAHVPIPPADEEALRTALQDLREDLSFVRHRWRDPSFDIWEEVLGDHFYTRVVQSEAMEKGAKLLQEMGDAGWQDLQREHEAIEGSLDQFVDPKNGHIWNTYNQRGGMKKYTDIDMATIMGALRRKSGTRFSVTDDHVLATAMRLYQAFHDDPSFEMNRMKGLPGLAMGRYPTDPWTGKERIQFDENGKVRSAGHPWIITTLAMGQLFYDAAVGFSRRKKIEINNLNRPFFEYVLYGHFPKEWTETLKKGRDARIILTPEEYPEMFHNILVDLTKRGIEYPARILGSGVKATDFTAEQFPGNIGAQGLAWNCAAFLGGLVPAIRRARVPVPETSIQ